MKLGDKLKWLTVSSNIEWNEQLQNLYNIGKEPYIFTKILDTVGPFILNQTLTSTSTNFKLPEGHPSLKNIIGQRLEYSGNIVGIISLACRDYPYTDDTFNPECIKLCNEFFYYLKFTYPSITIENIRYRNVFHNSFDIHCFARGSHFVKVNKIFKSILGYTEKEMLTIPIIDFIHPEDRSRTIEALKTLQIEGTDVLQFENRYITKSGKHRHLSWKANVYQEDLDKDENPLIIASARDITTMKKYEKQLVEANISKDEYLSRVSHELRTPLNSIIGFGQIMDLNNKLCIDDRDNLHIIIKSSKYLLLLINEVLDITRVDSGNIQLSIENILLDDIITEAVDMIKGNTSNKNITIRVSRTHYGTIILADKQRAIQILVNLLSNAIKYGNANTTINIYCNVELGGEHVSGSLTFRRSLSKYPKYLIINVSDSGCGISVPAKLFTPFERLGVDDNIPGTGLGLALSRKLSNKLNGDLFLKKTDQCGSTFSFAIPIYNLNIKNSEDYVSYGKCTKHSIIYIEDNAENFKLVSKIIKMSGRNIKLVHAAQGNIGFDLAKTNNYSMILLDINLPDTNGIDVLKRMRKVPVLSSVPIYIVSADATSRQKLMAIKNGATGYITKPLEIREMLDIITKKIPSS